MYLKMTNTYLTKHHSCIQSYLWVIILVKYLSIIDYIEKIAVTFRLGCSLLLFKLFFVTVILNVLCKQLRSKGCNKLHVRVLYRKCEGLSSVSYHKCCLLTLLNLNMKWHDKNKACPNKVSSRYIISCNFSCHYFISNIQIILSKFLKRTSYKDPLRTMYLFLGNSSCILAKASRLWHLLNPTLFV